VRSEPGVHVSAERAGFEVVLDNRAFFFYKVFWRKRVDVYALNIWVCGARSIVV